METEERTKFKVFKANILDDDGNKVLEGEVVALSPKLAKHYNKLGFLRPYFEEDEDDDEDAAESAREPVKPTRPRLRRGPTPQPL
jgi:predicted HicB family RNase H-like nuclease